MRTGHSQEMTPLQRRELDNAYMQAHRAEFRNTQGALRDELREHALATGGLIETAWGTVPVEPPTRRPSNRLGQATERVSSLLRQGARRLAALTR